MKNIQSIVSVALAVAALAFLIFGNGIELFTHNPLAALSAGAIGLGLCLHHRQAYLDKTQHAHVAGRHKP